MDNKNTTPSGKGKKQGNKPGRQMNFYWVYAIVAMFLLTMVMVGDSSTQRQVQWPDFKEMAEKGQITRVSHDGARANLYFTEAVRDSLTGGKSDPQLLQALYAGADASMNIPKGEAYQTELKELQESHGFDLRYEPPNEWGGQILSWVIFLGLMVVVWMFLMRRLGGGPAGGGQIFGGFGASFLEVALQLIQRIGHRHEGAGGLSLGRDGQGKKSGGGQGVRHA